MTSASFTLSEVIALTCDMNHGEVCGAAVLAAVDRAIESRREPGDPPAPRMTGLVVRRYGLPEWWNNGENLLLSAPDAQLKLTNGLGFQPVTGNLGVVGTGVRVRWLAFPGVGGLIAIGDGAELAFSDVAASNGGAVLIGEGTTARSFARVDSRNGGAVIVGADGMWANSVNIVTDDMHAVLDAQTGRRTNSYGGRIVVDHHVWLADHACVIAGARIGADTVVI